MATVFAGIHRVGRKKSDTPMAATRLWKQAYDAAKRAAKLDGVSAVTWISRVVLKAALERIAIEIETLKAKDLSGEIKSLQEKQSQQLSELASFIPDKKKPGPSAK